LPDHSQKICKKTLDLLAGPRQVGKTYLAKAWAKEPDEHMGRHVEPGILGKFTYSRLSSRDTRS
jgi:SpoVK/Ycf46/Vps4 family AAA+-type ATPase